MSLPREVIPGRFYLVTRRCTQRMFLMRPDDETNNAFVYCLQIAAERTGIDVIFTCALSNHHHTVIFDRDGTYPIFLEHFHKLFAKCQNALRGRWENFWAAEKPSVVRLVDPADVIAKIVYAACNPVKDHLVEKATQWPGVNALAAFVANRPMRARRPAHFFRSVGTMPEVVSLRFAVPEELGDRKAIVQAVLAGVAEIEEAAAKYRKRTGARIIGRRGCKGQSWQAQPTSIEPRRVLDPRVAAKNKWARIEALRRNREFLQHYRDARRAWLEGSDVVFPPGTYWLQRFAKVAVAAA